MQILNHSNLIDERIVGLPYWKINISKMIYLLMVFEDDIQIF
jgi:hypothetical protein